MIPPPSISTACPYCGVGCGITARVLGGRDLLISGDPSHPANAGRLCSKGAALGATVGLEGRLLSPMIGDKEVTWSEATNLVARRFAQTVARHGPDSVAFYVSGQLLTEDYYAANKLMKGFIGSGNIDTNSRLCMASAVVAHKQAFGADLVPGCYEDLDLADLRCSAVTMPPGPIRCCSAAWRPPGRGANAMWLSIHAALIPLRLPICICPWPPRWTSGSGTACWPI